MLSVGPPVSTVVCAAGDSVSLATTPVADANVAWGGQDPTDVNRVGPRVSGILGAPTASHAFRLLKDLWRTPMPD